MTTQHFAHCELDPCVYYKKLANGEFVILLIYVDDMLVVGTSVRIVHELKKNLAQCFFHEIFRGSEEDSWDDIN